MEQAVEQPRIVQFDPPGIQEAWDMVAGQLQLEMKQAKFDSWVLPLKAVGFNDGVFRLSAVNAYARDWVEGHLRSRITRLLEGIYNQPLTVSFVLSNLSATATAFEDATALGSSGLTAEIVEKTTSNGRRKPQPAADALSEGSPRKIQLQRAYGTERARVIQPERGMFLTMYFLNYWLPLLG